MQQWRIRTASAANYAVPMGVMGDLPVLMDLDLDGRTDLGIWRPSTGEFRVQRSSNNLVAVVTLGSGGDVPVPGDYVGTNHDDFAVFQPWSWGSPWSGAMETVIRRTSDDLALLALQLAGVLVALCVLDVVRRRWALEQSLRMTAEEQREEAGRKPLIKRRQSM